MRRASAAEREYGRESRSSIPTSTCSGTRSGAPRQWCWESSFACSDREQVLRAANVDSAAGERKGSVDGLADRIRPQHLVSWARLDRERISIFTRREKNVAI